MISTSVNTFTMPILQKMSNNNGLNGYESDNSTKSSNSTGSSNSSNSFNSTGSSNNYQDKNKSSDYNSTLNHSINYYKRKKWSKSRNRKMTQTTNMSNNLDNCESCYLEIGYTSNLSRDTPFIKFLIDKRINFCQLGNSSHIAALVPVTFNSRCCFKHCGKWKSRYR